MLKDFPMKEAALAFRLKVEVLWFIIVTSLKTTS